MGLSQMMKIICDSPIKKCLWKTSQNKFESGVSHSLFGEILSCEK